MNAYRLFRLIAIFAISFANRASIAQDDKAGHQSAPLTFAEERDLLGEMKARDYSVFTSQALDTTLSRDKRAGAVLKISELGTPEAASFLESVWDTPLNVLDHERLCLIDWASKYCGSNCVPMLLKGLRQDWRDERWHAARALATVQGIQALPILQGLARNDPDGIVRSQTEEFIKDLTDSRPVRVDEAEHAAVIVAIIDWAKSSKSETYIKDPIVYLLANSHPRIVETESLRLYSMPELILLGKRGNSYAISGLNITDTEAFAVLCYAEAPPSDPVYFPYSGWLLKLTKTDQVWSVTDAARKETIL